MDWESWPIGRPGPSVPERRWQEMMRAFQHFNAARDEQSRTKANVVHVAEFSSSGRGEFDLSRSSPESQSVQRYLLDTSRPRGWLIDWK